MEVRIEFDTQPHVPLYTVTTAINRGKWTVVVIIALQYITVQLDADD
jgi:hypothetical protein